MTERSKKGSLVTVANRRRQSGAVLFVGLVLLLILTLLGLSSSNVSILQERMAGNLAQSNEAFQIAESALRDIESSVYNGICLGGGSGGLGTIPQWASLGVNLNDCTLTGSGLAANAASWSSPPNTPQPGGNGWARFFIVQLPAQPNCHAAGSDTFDSGQIIDQSYLVAASGRARSGTSEAIVESIITCVQ